MRALLKFVYKENLFLPVIFTSNIMVTSWRITHWNSLRTLIKRTTKLCIQTPSATPVDVNSVEFLFSVLCMLSQIVGIDGVLESSTYFGCSENFVTSSSFQHASFF